MYLLLLVFYGSQWVTSGLPDWLPGGLPAVAEPVPIHPPRSGPSSSYLTALLGYRPAEKRHGRTRSEKRPRGRRRPARAPANEVRQGRKRRCAQAHFSRLEASRTCCQRLAKGFTPGPQPPPRHCRRLLCAEVQWRPPPTRSGSARFGRPATGVKLYEYTALLNVTVILNSYN